MVAASLRQGIRMVSSVIGAPAPPPKKKVPRRVPFVEAKAWRLAAAGARQILRADGRAVRRQAAAPAVERLALTSRELRRGGGVRQRDQRDDRGVHHGRDPLHGGQHFAVLVGRELVDVLRLLRGGGDLAAPAVVPRRGRRTRLIHLGDRRAAGAHRQNDFRHLGADRVVLIGGQRNRRQNIDDRDHDHLFDQGEALLKRFHLELPSIGGQLGRSFYTRPALYTQTACHPPNGPNRPVGVKNVTETGARTAHLRPTLPIYVTFKAM